MAQMVKNPPAMRETWVWSLGWEDPLEEGMATHSSILAWGIPMDRGAWWATVHGVTTSQTLLSDWAHNICTRPWNHHHEVSLGLFVILSLFSLPSPTPKQPAICHYGLFLIFHNCLKMESWSLSFVSHFLLVSIIILRFICVVFINNS